MKPKIRNVSPPSIIVVSIWNFHSAFLLSLSRRCGCQKLKYLDSPPPSKFEWNPIRKWVKWYFPQIMRNYNAYHRYNVFIVVFYKLYSTKQEFKTCFVRAWLEVRRLGTRGDGIQEWTTVLTLHLRASVTTPRAAVNVETHSTFECFAFASYVEWEISVKRFRRKL